MPRYKDTFPLSLFMYGGMETWAFFQGSCRGACSPERGLGYWVIPSAASLQECRTLLGASTPDLEK